jgi:hypothetical protein
VAMFDFLLVQPHGKWPTPGQWWHLISEVRPVDVVDDEYGFAAA